MKFGIMQKRKQHPSAAGVIAAIFKKFRKSYAITATATWRADGLWVEGTIGTDGFELLANYKDENEDAEIVVEYLCTWTNNQ